MSLSSKKEPFLTSRDPKDLDVPGVSVEFEPDEAEALGAIEDGALTLDEAMASNREVAHHG